MAALPPPPLGPGAALPPPPPGPGAALPPPPPGPSPLVPPPPPGCLDSMAVDGFEPQHGTAGGGDPKMRTDAGDGKRKNPNGSSLVPSIIKASRKSANTGIRSPMQATSSPGVNFLLKSAAVKKEAVNRASMAGSPKTQQPPSCSPSLHDLSPDTRATNSQASKRKHRKLISDIWKEAEPIYKDGKLVEGKCNHCHEIFAASRDTGTSHMKRHLKLLLRGYHTARKAERHFGKAPGVPHSQGS